MIKDVIETYKSLLSCRRSLPGMSLEEAFSNNAVKSIEKELEWLKTLDKEKTEKEGE